MQQTPSSLLAAAAYEMWFGMPTSAKPVASRTLLTSCSARNGNLHACCCCSTQDMVGMNSRQHYACLVCAQ